MDITSRNRRTVIRLRIISVHEADILKEVKPVPGSEMVIVGHRSTDKRQKVRKPSTRKRQLTFKNDSEL